MKINVKRILLIFGMLQLVSCTQEFKRSIGIIHSSPNEYAVLKSPPLSIPPNFELVPPPEDVIVSTSSDEPVRTDAGPLVVEEASKKSIVPEPKTFLEKQVSGKVSISESDSSFIGRFNGHENRPDIRELVELQEPDAQDKKNAIQKKDENHSGEISKPKTLIDKLKGWF